MLQNRYEFSLNFYVLFISLAIHWNRVVTMGTLGKRHLLQKNERVCPLCGELIGQRELVGRRKYHEVCGALLKRIIDITRMRFRFWRFVSRRDCPPTAIEAELMWQKMTEESAESVLKRAEDSVWILKTIGQYYKETFTTRGDVIKLKSPYLEESLKARGKDGDTSRYMQGKHSLLR